VFTDALKTCNITDTPDPKRTKPNQLSVLWNGMMNPLTFMTIKSVLWYQGENNKYFPGKYTCSFPSMVQDWRSKWGGSTSKQFPFFYVQLAPWISVNETGVQPSIRLAQTRAESLVNVFGATAMDTGETGQSDSNIHPRNKKPVAHRLALLARSLIYGEEIQSLSPRATSWSVEGRRVRITFNPESVATGLKYVPKSCFPTLAAELCAEFEVLVGSKWVPSSVAIDQKDLILEPVNYDGISTINGARYGWANYPLATIYNNEDLPAFPFAFPFPYFSK